MPLSLRIGALLLVSAFVQSCASRQEAALPPHNAEMSARITESDPSAEMHSSTGVAPPRHSGELTLAEAVALTIKFNSGLAAAAWRAGAMEAEQMQAGLAPNPDIDFGAEEFGGTGDRSGLQSAELSVALSQVVELGSKRAKRLRAAELDYDLARWEYEITRITTLTETATSFIDAIAAREHLALAQEAVLLAGRFYTSAAEMVSAGKAAPLEQTRAQVVLAREKSALTAARSEDAAARGRLAVMWGGDAGEVASVTGVLDNIPAPPSITALQSALSSTPDLMRWAVELERHFAEVTLEKSRRIPDVTVAAGAARFREIGENALIAGVSIPLPLFDRNQGNVLRAERLLAAAREDRQAGEAAIRQELWERHTSLATSREQVSAFLTEIVPAAKSALAASEEGYRAGKYSYLDVIEARRTYIEVRGESIDALAACHTARTELERLIGEPLDVTAHPATKDSE